MKVIHRVSIVTAAALAFSGSLSATQMTPSSQGGTDVVLQPSRLSLELTGLRFDDGVAGRIDQPDGGDFGDERVADSFRDGSDSPPGTKSPFKAFALSMIVPGAGQLYYGSKTKAVAFFAADVALWALQFKWHADGVDMEDEFEAYNRKYWSRERYEQQYLLWAYGEADDDLISEQEVSHHLPDTRTQQYYEMTGKYNQFAWGWEDAEFDGNTLDDYSAGNPPPRIISDALTPYSRLRLDYEQMRADANSKLEDARKMIMVSILNRLISGFEAYFSTKRHNDALRQYGSGESRLDVRAALASYNSLRDTPFLHVAWRF
ncbi:MAG: hypothetical protein RBT76_12905 [candidate division Zixibacteria bacterium]|jgi:hypothetical protein|nr:hypothetical protein [candidate division Zixibacteria bacterium]